jgi:hypothetical protein
MKKWKISAKKDHALTLFNSSESLYTWIVNGATHTSLSEKKYVKETVDIRLKKGDVIEIEWLGSEYVQEDKTDTVHTLREVQILLLHQLDGVYPPVHAEAIEGWISDEIIDLSENRSTFGVKPKNRRPLKVELVLEDLIQDELKQSQFNEQLSF